MAKKRVNEMNDEILQNRSIMQDFPKIELHRHLEGSFPLQKLHEIALKNQLPVSKNFPAFKKDNQFPRDGEPDFLLFLSKFKNDWYRSLQDVYDITYFSVLQFKNDGLFYIELRFNPEHFAQQNNFDRTTVTKTVIEAAKRAASEIGLQIKFLITLNRGQLKPAEMFPIFEATKNISSDICGYDLAGDETNFPPELFSSFFSQIFKEGKYKVTIHAGEVSPSSQIWTAIRDLHACRIGHGTAIIHDEELQEYVKASKIVLEQCLTSNYQTGSWRDITSHPFGELFRKGVPVTLNSDDPSIQDKDLTDDYMIAQRNFKLSYQDLISINLTAIDASFLTPEEKATLRKKYLQALANFETRHHL